MWHQFIGNHLDDVKSKIFYKLKTKKKKIGKEEKIRKEKDNLKMKPVGGGETIGPPDVWIDKP